MLYKVERTPNNNIYIINGNAVRYLILIILLLFAAMYFSAIYGQATLSIVAFYLIAVLSALFFLASVAVCGRMFIAAIKGKKVTRTSETKGVGWGKNNFIWRIEIER